MLPAPNLLLDSLIDVSKSFRFGSSLYGRKAEVLARICNCIHPKGILDVMFENSRHILTKINVGFEIDGLSKSSAVCMQQPHHVLAIELRSHEEKQRVIGTEEVR